MFVYSASLKHASRYEIHESMTRTKTRIIFWCQVWNTAYNEDFFVGEGACHVFGTL